MKEKLIKLLNDSEVAYEKYLREIHEKLIKEHITTQGLKRYEFYADYLLANGVIVPPCKVGDTMYDISEFVNCVPCPEMYEDNVTFITIMNRKNGEMYFDIECVECDYNDFGKTIFFTKEEAEQALSKLQASYEQVEGGEG